tara:strand:- start:403 stop:591 length:189 start_codon:yes stop_codon:yes gene_type:complete
VVVVVGHTVALTVLVLMAVEEVALERKALVLYLPLLIAVVVVAVVDGRELALLKMVVLEVQE